MADRKGAPARWTAQVATDEAHELGEGPLWDPLRRRLMWVDIRAGLVLTGELRPDDTIAVTGRDRFDETVGAVAVAADGRRLIAGALGLIVQGEDGERVNGPVLLDEPRHRLNDGKSDPRGRYLVGSLSLDGPSTGERLWLIDHDGAVRVLDDDLTLSNGLAWTAGGTRMFSVDTECRTVFVRDYEPATAATGPREVAFTIEDGYPDGMCADAEDHLWIAIWGRGQVRRYTTDGTLVGIVEVPAPHTSSVAFAGPELDTLVVTTATQSLGEDELALWPLSGRLFTARTGVRGRPEALWNPGNRAE